MQGINGNS